MTFNATWQHDIATYNNNVVTVQLHSLVYMVRGSNTSTNKSKRTPDTADSPDPYHPWVTIFSSIYIFMLSLFVTQSIHLGYLSGRELRIVHICLFSILQVSE